MLLHWTLQKAPTLCRRLTTPRFAQWGGHAYPTCMLGCCCTELCPVCPMQPSTSQEPQTFAEGDLVVGKVVWATPKGAKVELLDHPGVSA